MIKFKTPNRSFSTRLSLWFTGYSAAILLAFVGVSLYFVYTKIKQDTVELSKQSAQVYADEIADKFRIAEVAAINVAPAMKRLMISSPDSVILMLKPVLDNNEDLYGVGVSIENGILNDTTKMIAPYMFRGNTDGTYRTDNVQNYMTEAWYRDTKTLGHPHWSKPYFGRVGKKYMVDYCIPIYDDNGQFVGVFAVDITLEWIEKMLDRQNLLDESFVQVADAEGHVLAFRGTPISDHDAFTFHHEIKNLGWKLSVTFSEDSVMRPVRILQDILLLILLLGLTLLLLATRMAVEKLARPVVRFARAAEEISKGNFNTQLPEVKTQDELMLLHHSLDDMQHELSLYIEDLKQTVHTSARIESELHVANRIQMAMLPTHFTPDIFGILKPAREVGGDLYDFFSKGNNLFFIIGDVSGKGVGSSLYMAVTTKVFRNVAYHVDHPSRIVTSLNHSLSENNSQNVFVTLFVGMLNKTTGKLTYCNAGHNPPILIQKDEVGFLPVKPNISCGVLGDAEYEEQNLQLEPGDRLLLYTDGVTEAQNVSGCYYSEERLLQAVTEHHQDSPQQLVEYVQTDVEIFALGAEQSDDITVFCINNQIQA